MCFGTCPIVRPSFFRNADDFLDRLRYGQAMVKQPGPLCAKLGDGVQLVGVPGL